MIKSNSSEAIRQKMLDAACSPDAAGYSLSLSLPRLDALAATVLVSRTSAYRIWPSQEALQADILRGLIDRYVTHDEAVYAEKRRWLGRIASQGAAEEYAALRDNLIVTIGNDEVERIGSFPIVPRLRHVIESQPDNPLIDDLRARFNEAQAGRSEALSEIYADIDSAFHYGQLDDEETYSLIADESLALAESIAVNPSLQAETTKRTLFLAIASAYTAAPTSH